MTLFIMGLLLCAMLVLDNSARKLSRQLTMPLSILSRNIGARCRARRDTVPCGIPYRAGYRAVWDTVPCGIPCSRARRIVCGEIGKDGHLSEAHTLAHGDAVLLAQLTAHRISRIPAYTCIGTRLELCVVAWRAWSNLQPMRSCSKIVSCARVVQHANVES